MGTAIATALASLLGIALAQDQGELQPRMAEEVFKNENQSAFPVST
jgi:hypothetical protein